MLPGLVLAFLVMCAASQTSLVVESSPTPVIKSETTQIAAAPPKHENAPPTNSIATTDKGAPPLQMDVQLQPKKAPASSNLAEKLRRGLTNFINHHNPGSFFVPNANQFPSAQTKQSTKVTSTREPPTIVSDAPSAEAVIKGPNRLVQARPLGGPLRWGRR